MHPETTPKPDDAALTDAVTAWQAGPAALPPGRAEEILHRLKADANLRRQLAERIATLAWVRISQAPEPRWLALTEALGLDQAPPDTTADAAWDATLLATVKADARTRSRRGTWLTLGALAAAVALGLWLYPFPSPSPTMRADKTPLAMVVKAESAGAKGLPRSLGQVGLSVPAGPLQFEQGLVSLMFASGVVLHVEGPAHLALLTPDRVLCHEGRVRLHVPKGAEGFCIETPGGAVTDLGTELGVTVGRDGETQVAVFEGAAEASLRLPGQDGVRTELLTAAQSVQMRPETGEIVSRTVDDASFLPPTSLSVPPLRLSPGYEELILTSRPVLYWPLDQMENGQLPNRVPTAPDLRLAGSARLQPPPAADSRGTVAFGGKKDPGALFATEEWLAPGKAHAVEMWFASTDTAQMDLLAFTTGKAPNDHLELLELPVRQPGRTPRPGIVRYLTRWPAGSGGGINIYTAPQYLPYQWHHLVAQQSGGKMELYLNGQPAGRADADAFPDAIPCRIQLGCLRFKEGGKTSSIERAFAGQLAQVAIYDRLLTPEEILARFQAKR